MKDPIEIITQTKPSAIVRGLFRLLGIRAKQAGVPTLQTHARLGEEALGRLLAASSTHGRAAHEQVMLLDMCMADGVITAGEFSQIRRQEVRLAEAIDAEAVLP